MSRSAKKLIRQGDYIAEVDVNLTDDPEGWGPYLSLEDARRLDEVRSALCDGNLARAAELANVYRLAPVRTSA